MGSLHRWIATCLLVAGVGVAWQATGQRRAAAAGPNSEAQRLRAARTHYEKAVSHYNLDELEAALVEFREAYRAKPDPSFLFNIAQCHRKLGQRDAAIDFYRKYVRASPDAANRAEAERWIAELKARGDDAAASATADGSTLAAPAAAGTGPTAVTPIDVPPSASSRIAAPPAPAAPVSASPQSSSPALDLSSSGHPEPAATPAFYQRWWFWTALGAVAVGATVTAFALGAKAPSPYAGNIPPGTVRVPNN
jgi:tetratricopeptide (TPR) repeat protein